MNRECKLKYNERMFEILTGKKKADIPIVPVFIPKEKATIHHESIDAVIYAFALPPEHIKSSGSSLSQTWINEAVYLEEDK